MHTETIAAAVAEFCARCGSPGNVLNEIGLARVYFDDNSTLMLECTENDLIIILGLPNCYLNAAKLAELLAIANCHQGWPLPLAAGLATDNNMQALLMTWISLDKVSCTALEAAV